MTDSASETKNKAESLFEAPPMGEQERMVEAIIFASAEPVTVKELNARMPHGCDAAEALVHLRKRYEGRGVHVVKIGDAWAVRTAADLGFLMQKETIETRKLSRAATKRWLLLPIINRSPALRSGKSGVSVSRGTVDQLLEMEWIRFGRRKMTPGRPVTFVVTRHFLIILAESARLTGPRGCVLQAFWKAVHRGCART